MKSMKGAAMMMALAAMSLSTGTTNEEREYLGELETTEEREKRLKAAEIRINKANGLTEFKYMEGSLWALNEKSANKKAKKRGWNVY